MAGRGQCGNSLALPDCANVVDLGAHLGKGLILACGGGGVTAGFGLHNSGGRGCRRNGQAKAPFLYRFKEGAKHIQVIHA